MTVPEITRAIQFLKRHRIYNAFEAEFRKETWYANVSVMDYLRYQEFATFLEYLPATVAGDPFWRSWDDAWKWEITA